MKNRIIVLTLMIMLAVGSAEGKWWIFGASENEVTINYLQLNDRAYDELGPKTTLYQEILPDGTITIRGKASVKKGKVGSVRISLDNKENWEEAKLAERGGFEFSFKPEIGKPYVLYLEVMDTAGKTNNIEATRRELIVSEQSISVLIKEALDKMIAAYESDNAPVFMSYVDEDFAGDRAILERAIKNDFSLFDNIDLEYSLSDVAFGAKGIFISLNYSRRVDATRSGQSFTDKGATAFVFKIKDKGPRVYSMKNPLLFGLSDAGEVATGNAPNDAANPIIVVDPNNGTIGTQPYNEAVNIISGGDTTTTATSTTTTTTTTSVTTTTANPTVRSGSNLTMNIPGHPPVGFNFVNASIGMSSSNAFELTGNASAYGGLLLGNDIADLGAVSISSITEAPAGGYSHPDSITLTPGNSYAFKLADNTYALLEAKSVTVADLVVTFIFDYKYQPDGTRSF